MSRDVTTVRVSTTSMIRTRATTTTRTSARRARRDAAATARGGEDEAAATNARVVDDVKDARALAPSRGVGRERLVATVGASSTGVVERVREATSSGRGAAAVGGGAAVVVGGAGAVAMNRVLKAKSGQKDPQMQVLDRYANLIVDAYDIPHVPNFAEGAVYREICKTAYEMALENMMENIGGVNVLGHPVTLSNTLNLTHVPTKSGIKEKDLNAFIDELVGETSGIPVLLPGPLERVMYTNGVLTGWTVFEDSLKTFKLQMFDREFVFSVSDDDDGKRLRRTTSGSGVLETMPKLSDDVYVKIARDELELSGPTNVFPRLQRNVAKVAVGMLSEALTLEAKIKGFTVELALDPYGESNADAFASVSFGEEDRQETKRAMEELIEVCVDEYMTTRSMAISSVFLPRAIERQTYINVLQGLFGDIGKEPVMTNLGFDVSMRLVRPDPSSSAEGDDASTDSSDDKSSSGRNGESRKRTNLEILSDMGDELRRGDFRRLASDARSIMGISLEGDEDPDAIETEIARKAAQKETRKTISEFVDYLLRDPMYNVKAIPDNIERLLYINCFELIFDVLSTVLSDFELDMLGRRIRMEVKKAPTRSVTSLTRFRPDANALSEFTKEFEQMPAVREIMMNVFAFVLAFIAQLLSDFEVTVVGHRLQTSLSRRDDAVFIRPVYSEASDALNETLLKVIESFAQDVFAVSSRAGMNVGGGSETRTRAELDFDKEAFALFESNASKPDDKFPFPYLNPEQFATIIDKFIDKIVPGATEWDSHNETVQRITRAADLNGDGVIQWAEWYYAAKAINDAISKENVGNVATTSQESRS